MFLCILASLVSHFIDAYTAVTNQEGSFVDPGYVTELASGDAPTPEDGLYPIEYTHQTHIEVMPIRCSKRTRHPIASKSESDERVKYGFKHKHDYKRMPYKRR